MLIPMLMTPMLLVAMTLPPVEKGQLNRGPQMAVRGREVVMVFGSGQKILFAKSADEGATFSAPRVVAEGPVLPLTRHRGPRIVFSGNALVVTAVVGKTLATGPHAHGLPSDGDLVSWRSEDGGGTWSSAKVVNDVPGAAREGLHALGVDAKGRLAAAWLDLRAGGTRLFAAHSEDGGKSWGKNELLYESKDGTICQCCHPTVFAEAGGFAVMFRNVLGGERDMYVMRPGKGARKLGEGTWKINACPMDGGGVAVAGSTVVTAWRREETVYLAVEGEKEVALGAGKDVALAAGGRADVAAVWVEAGKVVSYRGAVDAKGKRAVLAASGAFPSVVRLAGGGYLAAWEENGSVRVGRVE